MESSELGVESADAIAHLNLLVRLVRNGEINLDQLDELVAPLPKPVIDVKDLVQRVVALPNDPAAQREAMVDEVKASLLEGGVDLSSENISRVVKAMLAVPREEFLPPWARDFAYLPYALNIGSRQTISQPFVVALMAMAATIPPGAAVLDVGTGSGYGAAVLSMLADTVVTIEIKTKLARDAEQQFSALGFRNITTVIGDGFAGVPAFAPFDVILVAAAASQVPQPLVEQLKPGGRLIMPLGPDPENEHLVMLTKQPDGTLRQVTLGPVQFVPLTGSGARA